jgi:ABC-type uncharacterized transport system permease subunit
LGECLTEKSGKINLGLEGTLLTGAMTAYAVSYLTGSAWVGVIAAGLAGMVLGGIHGWLCQQPRVNDVAVGIAMIIFGSGIAFFFGKPFIQPQAPQLPSIEFFRSICFRNLSAISRRGGDRAFNELVFPFNSLGSLCSCGGRQSRCRQSNGFIYF